MTDSPAQIEADDLVGTLVIQERGRRRVVVLGLSLGGHSWERPERGRGSTPPASGSPATTAA